MIEIFVKNKKQKISKIREMVSIGKTGVIRLPLTVIENYDKFNIAKKMKYAVGSDPSEKRKHVIIAKPLDAGIELPKEESYSLTGSDNKSLSLNIDEYLTSKQVELRKHYRNCEYQPYEKEGYKGIIVYIP